MKFEETDADAAVYRVTGSYKPHEKIHIPSKVKSVFAEEHDVQYDRCRAELKGIDGRLYVVVGEIPP